MLIREAQIEDIKQLHFVRNAVLENKLTDPTKVTEHDYFEFLTVRGRGWVCETNNRIVGFSIVDLKNCNVWALFLVPEFEKQGIGIQLHNIMLDWYFGQTKSKLWLGTEPKTRAEMFYRKSGWKEVVTHGNGEIKFEMTYADWTKHRNSKISNRAIL